MAEFSRPLAHFTKLAQDFSVPVIDTDFSPQRIKKIDISGLIDVKAISPASQGNRQILPEEQLRCVWAGESWFLRIFNGFRACCLAGIGRGAGRRREKAKKCCGG